LPEEVRAILEEVAREVQTFVYESAERMDAELLDLLVAEGMEVNQPDHAVFSEASSVMYREFAETVVGGGELIETALAAGQ
jgi:TRAP-type C4-dicarboxylate transport system substrate-binding protein